MWPFRPDRLTEVLPAEELRLLLGVRTDVGSAVTLVERGADDAFVSIDPFRRSDETGGDPFCAYFRHGKVGGKPAFEGADEACALCEQRFARRLLRPQGSAPLATDERGVARLRCHMGLMDFLVPVRVGGKVVAGLIAGRRLESEEDRQRVRKSTGKLGKLTRAEAESAASGDRTVIAPADDRARERLIREIESIPVASADLPAALARLGEWFSRLATRQYEGQRWALDDALVEAVDFRPAAEIQSFPDLRLDAEKVAEEIRVKLDFEFLALFALLPKELDRREAHPSLVAASGLGVPTARRLIDLDWTRLPPSPSESGGDYLRGLESVSATIHALISTPDAPAGLKDRLTKCVFFAPVEIGNGLPAAVAYGPTASVVTPLEPDFRLLTRIARAVARRYYTQAAVVERHWLSQKISQEGDVRRRAEAARKAAELTVREIEAARRQAELTRGFSHFNFRKLVDQSIEKVQTLAASRGVEIDARTLPERVMYDGERHRLARAVDEILLRCIARTRADGEGRKPAPVLVLLKRGRDGLTCGAEAVGDWLDGDERRSLFAREPQRGRGASPRPAGPDRAAGPRDGGGPGEAGSSPGTGNASDTASPAEAAPSRTPEAVETPETPDIRLPPTLREVLAVTRRHTGRLRVESERLRRSESEPRRWIGKTVFLLELPFLVKREEGESSES